MDKGYHEIQLFGFLDKQLKEVAKNISGSFRYEDMAEYFLQRGEAFAIGEYWGKLVRGGCIAYRYFADETLKQKLVAAAKEMISVRRKNGDLSAVAPERQPQGKYGSDIWERKYVLLGLIEIYKTFGMAEALDCAVSEAKLLAKQVGEPPKMPITETGWAFFGIESSSVLDPIMQLYNLTGETELLEFARYIVKSGCCKRGNIFLDLDTVAGCILSLGSGPYQSIQEGCHAYHRRIFPAVPGLSPYAALL